MTTVESSGSPGRGLIKVSRRCVKALTIVLILAMIYFVYSILKIFAGFLLAYELNCNDWENASWRKRFWLILEFATPFVLLLLFIPLLFYLGVAFQTFDYLFLNHKGGTGKGAEYRKVLRNTVKPKS